MLLQGWRKLDSYGATLRTLSWSLLFGTALIAVAYVPTYLHPYFDRVQDYLGVRMGHLFGNFNLAFFVEMATFYNSIYFVAALIVLMAAGLWIALQRHSIAAWLLILWFLPYLILYLFVIQFPGTHFYLLMPSWSLLAALPLAHLTGPCQSRRWLRAVAGTALLLWVVISTFYLHLIFFRQAPEYLVNYQQERAPFYWAPYGEEIPEKPRFGFPILEGWKTLGVLSEWGYLNGTYTSNEHSRFLRWYLGDFDYVKPDEGPDFVFVATHVQEEDPTFDDDMLDTYVHFGEVRVRGMARLALWAKSAPSAGYAVYDAENFTGVFDGLVPTFEEWPDPPPTRVDVAISPALTLVQAGADRQRAEPGDVVHLLLRWQVQTPTGSLCTWPMLTCGRPRNGMHCRP